jgi:hypothetical protein
MTSYRSHVTQDLRPYICVFEDCQSAEELYVSSDEWLEHMRQAHAQRRWVCTLCDRMNSRTFDDVEGFQKHMRETEDHAELFTEQQLPILCKMSMRLMPLELTCCPLCKWSQAQTADGMSLQDHIAEHIHSFALRSLLWDEVNEEFVTGADVEESQSIDSDGSQYPTSTGDIMQFWKHEISLTKLSVERAMSETRTCQMRTTSAKSREQLALFYRKLFYLHLILLKLEGMDGAAEGPFSTVDPVRKTSGAATGGDHWSLRELQDPRQSLVPKESQELIERWIAVAPTVDQP